MRPSRKIRHRSISVRKHLLFRGIVVHHVRDIREESLPREQAPPIAIGEKFRFTFRLNLRDPDLALFGKTIVVTVFTTAIFLLCYLTDSQAVTAFGEGSVSAVYYADKLFTPLSTTLIYSISAGNESMRLNLAVGNGRAAVRFRGISFYVRGDVFMGSYSILDADTAVVCEVGKDFAKGCIQLELMQKERELFCLATAICLDSLNVGSIPALQMT